MKYLIAARVSPKGSTWDQHETSIPTQVNVCRDWIKTNDPKGEVIDVLVEEFVSGGSMKGRDLLAAEIDAAEAGLANWDVLCVYNQTRHSRNLLDTLVIQKKLEAAGKYFVAVTDGIDTRDEWSAELIQFKGLMAEAERRRISRQVKDKMVRIAREGGWPCGNAPFGYKRGERHDNTLQADPPKAVIVRDLFERYAAGVSALELGKPYGISKSSVLYILANPIYTGVIRYDGQVYAGRHQALISQDQFDAVQARMPRNRSGRRPQAETHVYILNALYWHDCGRRLIPCSAKGRNQRYYYYECRPCKVRVRAEETERRILYGLQQMDIPVSDVDRYLAELATAKEQQRAEQLPALRDAERALKSAQKAQNAATDVIMSGLLTPETAPILNARLRDAVAEVERLEHLVEDLRRQTRQIATPLRYRREIVEALGSLQARITATWDEPALLRDVLLASLSRIERRPDGELITFGSSNCTEWLPGLHLDEPLRIWLAGESVRLAV